MQLKKKFKKDCRIIDKILGEIRPEDNVEWFEKQYNIDITNFNQQKMKHFQSEGIFEQDSDSLEQFHSEEAMGMSAGHVSAGLISSTGIGPKRK